MSIAVIAALPREISGLVRGLKPNPELKQRGIFLYRRENAMVVAAGMGASRVSLAVEAAFQHSDVKTLISTGLAGACTADLNPGSVVEADNVVDANTGEWFAPKQAGQVVLVSTAGIAGVKEKARLAASYAAAAVDMEAATVARIAAAHGVPFRAIKAISDAHDFEMTSLSRFADARGQFRTAAFALYTALHPAQWSMALELGKNSGKALRALTERLNHVILFDRK